MKQRLTRLLAIGFALTTVSASPLRSATDQREIAPTNQREINLLLSKLPGFRAYEMIKADHDFLPNAPSPDGRWMADIHEAPPPGPLEGGTYPHVVRLWDRDGRFVKDATQGIFYMASDFTWSQTSDAMYVKIVPSLETSSGIDPIWKLNLRHLRIMEPRLPYLPQTFDQELPVMSPSGNSYLLHDGLSRSIWRIWVRSGKHLQLTKGYYPRWSPDGRWVLFSRTEWGKDYLIIRADGRERRQLIKSRDIEKARVRQGWPKSIITDSIVPIGFVAHCPLILLNATYREKAVACSLFGGVWLVDYERMRHEFLPLPGLQPLGMSRNGKHLFLRQDSICYRLDYEPTKKTRTHRKRGDE